MFDFPLNFNFTLQFLNLRNLRKCLACINIDCFAHSARWSSLRSWSRVFFKSNDYVCLFVFVIRP